MPSSPSLCSIPSVPGTPTSFESTASAGRGPKVLNGRLVKSRHRQPTPITSTRSLPPSALGSPSCLPEGMKGQRVDRDNDDDYDDKHDEANDNENVHGTHVNPIKEPSKVSKHSKHASGNKIWKLMKRISTGGLRDKYAHHSPSFSMSSSSSSVPRSVAGGGGGGGGPARSLSRAEQLKVTKLSNYSEESLACSHQSHGSYGSLVASSSHASHGEPFAGPSALAFNAFNHDHVPPPVPAIPKDLQNHRTPNILLPPSIASSPSSPASLSFSDPGSNISRKYHQRDRDSRSASSPIPSISSPLSPGQLSSASHSSATSYSSPPPPHTPSPSPSAPNKKRILSRISSMGLLRKKPSIASGLASSLGFGVPAAGTFGTLDKTEEANTATEQDVPALFTIPTIPSSIPLTPPNNPSKASKSPKYSISCIPIPSIPSMPSMSIIASSTPSTPIKSTSTTAQISFSSSSSSRPGTGQTTLSQSSSVSSPRLSLDSRSRSHSRILAMRRRSRSKSRSRSRSRSSSLDSLGRRRSHRNDHAHTTPTRNNNKKRRNSNHQNNNNNHNTPAHSTTTIPLDKHIVPPLELSATLSGGEDDNRWGIEHVLSGDDDRVVTSSSSVSPPHIDEHSPPLDGVSVDPGLGPKRVNRSINTDKLEVMVEKENRVDKWERLLERVEKWDKLDLDKLDGVRSKSVVAGRESWTIVRSPEQEELPSLPVPPRKRKERESSRREKWERSASVDVPASPVSSSPVYRGRAIMDDTPTPSTFGRVMGKQIGVEGGIEEKRRSSSSPVQSRASLSTIGDDGRKKNGRDGSRKRRSLSAARSVSALISPSSPSKDPIVLPPPRSWTKSLSSPTRRSNSENAVDVAAVVSTTTLPAPTPPRALGTLFRKLSFSGGSSSPAATGTNKRRNRSPKRPSTASSASSAKARSGFFWNGGNGDNNKQGELELPSSTLPVPRRLLRKNSLLKGRSNTGNQDKDDRLPTIPGATRMRRPRTADASSSISNNNNGTLTEKEKRERWENLLERSEKAGGTLHLRANGEGLLSDRMRMSMVSTVSEVSGAGA